jgi:cob(I)alamin adenosyltransferase
LPAPGTIRAGQAFVELYADDSKLVRGLKRAERRLKAFGARIRNVGLKVAAVGAAMLAPIVAATRTFASMGDDIAKMARRTGFAVEALSELRFAASQTGTDMKALESSLRRMQRSIYDAGRGLSTATDALQDLGLRFEDLDGLTPEQQFRLLADRIGALDDPTTRAAIAMSLFGRSGTALLPMFAQGAAGIEALQAKARELGLTMSAEDAAAAEQLTDALDALWKSVKMGVFRIGAALAPTFQTLAEVITGAIAKASDWIDQNRPLVAMGLQVAAAVVAAGAALIALGVAVQVAAFALGGLVTLASAAGTAIGVITTVLGALLSPIGLVAAAVVGLGITIANTTGATGKVIDWLGEKFDALAEWTGAVFGGVRDALAAGDITAAARVLWAGLKVAWNKGTMPLKTAWANVMASFSSLATDAFFAVRKSWLSLSTWFWKKFPDFTSRIATGWANMWGSIKAITAKVQSWLADRFLEIQGLFDDSLDVELAKTLNQDRLADELADIESKRLGAVSEAKRKSQLSDGELAAEQQEELERLQARRDAKINAIQEELARDIAGAEDDLVKARQELTTSINNARDARRRMEREKAEMPKAFEPPDVDDPESVGPGLSATIRGTFNPAALQGFAARDRAAERTADAVEKTEEHTRELARAARQSKLTFT